jgi:hypothetical protein
MCSAISAAVIVERCGVSRFDRAGQAPVQLRTFRHQLRFVGNGANQRMPERIFRMRSELHLINEFGLDEILEGRIDAQASQQIWTEPRTDDRCGAQRLLGLGIEAVDAGSDRGLQCGRDTYLTNSTA